MLGEIFNVLVFCFMVGAGLGAVVAGAFVVMMPLIALLSWIDPR